MHWISFVRQTVNSLDGRCFSVVKMTSKVFGKSVFSVFGKRALAAQAAPKAKPQAESVKPSLPKQDVQTTSLPNGLLVSTLENYSPISRVAVVVKAGSRYEDSDNLGIAHCIRNSAYLSTKSFSLFGLTRHIEYVGGNLSVTSDRENIIYQLECNRDEVKTYIKYLMEVVTKPTFKRWELEDSAPRMHLDIAQYNAHPENVLLDSLHRAAFRGGLSHSLCSPDFMVGRHSSDVMKTFWEQTFGSTRCSMVGVGLEHDLLLEQVEKVNFPTAKSGASGSSKYKGGEILVDMDLPVTYISVVGEGASLKSEKDVLALALLQQILGIGPRIKYSGTTTTKLGNAASKATDKPFAVTSLNISYSDTGLFGFGVVGQPEEMPKLIKSLVAQMKESCKAPSADELAKAKNKLKTTLLCNLESGQDILDAMVTEGSLTNAASIQKAIDSITAQDVGAVAAKVMKSKGTLAAVGKVHHCPYLEDLV